MRRSERKMLAGIAVVLQFLLGSSLALAQVGGETRTIDVADSPRPMADAIARLEALSGIPINYEDMPVYYSGDMKDVTDYMIERRRVPPEGERVFGLRGGQLSVPIQVDAATGKLPSIEAVSAALAAVVSAYNASDMPGDFEVESLNGVFFVKPVRYRDASGATQPMTPILSTPITLPEERRPWIQTMRLIVRQISAATGVQIAPNILRAEYVTIGAQNEPAHHVIARMLASRNGAVPAAANASWDSSFSYLFFCQHGFVCALNDRRARPINSTPRTPRRRNPPQRIIPPGQGTNTVP